MTGTETSHFPSAWDYLVITASNDQQAAAYRSLIDPRRSLGLVRGAKNVLVVADPGGRRVGSGGSTVHCLVQVLDRELGAERDRKARLDPRVWAETLVRLRILIVHAGGDSRRLPPYGPCGKIFVPVPGESGGALGTTLFDRLIPNYLKLPQSKSGGQVVVASGDVLLDFDAAAFTFSERGVTGIGALVGPEVATHHGVYCRNDDGTVGRFLQKPSVAKLREAGALDPQGRAILDIGILNFAPDAAVRLLELGDIKESRKGGRHLAWSGPVARAIERNGLDIYREVCCALGSQTGRRSYVEEVRRAGSTLSPEVLQGVYHELSPLPFHVRVLPRLRFLHFGTLGDLVESGKILLSLEMDRFEQGPGVLVNSHVGPEGLVRGEDGWIEGCRINAPLEVPGDNIVVGLDVDEPLVLLKGRSADVIEGLSRGGKAGWFVRTYWTDDVFHRAAGQGGRLCGLPVEDWLEAMDADPADVWEAKKEARERTVWNGRFFPFAGAKKDIAKWFALLEPKTVDEALKEDWRGADRYSLEEMAVRADLAAFQARRTAIRGEAVRQGLARALGPGGELSAAELAMLVRDSGRNERKAWILALLREAVRSAQEARKDRGLGSLGTSRVLHTTGSVLTSLETRDQGFAAAVKSGLPTEEQRVLRDLGVPVDKSSRLGAWAKALKEAAFRTIEATIVSRDRVIAAPPRNVLRSDEIVWGRAPARLDLGGGWTDTPPYSLEQGGCVINAAVDLNGQAPIQAYARVIDRHEIRIASIDHSTRVVIKTLDDLLDYRNPRSQFGLAKAALALAGFAPDSAAWPGRVITLKEMLRRFGGGIEITTLAAIPSGSGLGTSSIMGAVLISVIGRMIGRPLIQRELFHAVLKLEQELTTGGGWQDQIGGAIEGVKMITAGKGLVPDPLIRFVPEDVLEPATNGGRTLLYYTGLRRLAKNILHDVVGRYLDRDRRAIETLRRLHAFPPRMAEAMGTRDMERFGELVDAAWTLNVELDADHTNPVIEELRDRIRPYVSGAKLLGAGGGGFLLMVCRSSEDAASVKRLLTREPPNDKARFFDFSISRAGLVVTVC